MDKEQKYEELNALIHTYELQQTVSHMYLKICNLLSDYDDDLKSAEEPNVEEMETYQQICEIRETLSDEDMVEFKLKYGIDIPDGY